MRNSRRWKRWRIGTGMMVIMLASALVGCDQADWKNPQYISEQLKTGNSAEQSLALEKLEELEEETQEKVAPALTQVYLEGGANKKAVMQKLVEMRSSAAKEAYLKEVKSDETGYAGSAAEALGETETTDAIPEMLELYGETDSDDVKINVLRGLRHMPSTKMLDPLLETLELSVDNHPIALHSYSCEILGSLAEKNPGAFGEDAKRLLVRSVFLSNKKGQDVSQECSIAVQKLGEPLVPVLVDLFEGKLEEVNKLLRKYRTDSTQFPPNRPKVVATQRLTTLRAEPAKEIYLKDLKQKRELPTELADKFIRPWITFETRAIREMMMGLGELGAKEAKGLLEDAVRGEKMDAWSVLLDWKARLMIRQDAAFALARLGERDSAEILLEVAKTGQIDELQARAQKLEETEGYEPMPATQRYQLKWMTAKAYAALSDGGNIEAYQSFIEETSGEELEPVREKLESFVPMLELAKKCLGKEKPAGQAKCFGEGFGSDDKLVREKAAWELMRLPSEAAGPVVVEHLDTDDLNAREILTLGLYEHPQEKAIAKIGEILEAEEDESSTSYKLDHYRLKLLRAWLKNQLT